MLADFKFYFIFLKILGLCKMLERFRQLVVYCYNYEVIFNYLPFNHNNILTSDFLVISSIC